MLKYFNINMGDVIFYVIRHPNTEKKEVKECVKEYHKAQFVEHLKRIGKKEEVISKY